MRLPANAILGEVGQGFAPMQLRLNVRRLQIGAWAIGLSRRALDMMCTHVEAENDVRDASGRPPGDPVVDRGRRHADPCLPSDGARRGGPVRPGEDIRQAAAMVKVFATEMAGEIVDHAMQAFGAMGMTKELPLQLMAQKARVMRIYEGPSEVHRMTIARRILASVK